MVAEERADGRAAITPSTSGSPFEAANTPALITSVSLGTIGKKA